MQIAPEPSEALPATHEGPAATWRGDLGGALGDLGTLLPYLVGFIVVAGVQAASILLAFGLSLITVGWRFGIPFPVQPMKAVGAAALAGVVMSGQNMPAVLALSALIAGVFFNQPVIWLAAIGLAAAQIPLTFGNAILGIVSETRRLFPRWCSSRWGSTKTGPHAEPAS